MAQGSLTMDIITLLAQTKELETGLPGQTLGVGAAFTALLGFLIWFAKQLHEDAKVERAAAAAERIKTAETYKETTTQLASVVDRNTEAHVRANVILTRVEDRLDREDKRTRP